MIGEFGELIGKFGELTGKFGELTGKFGKLIGEFGKLTGKFGRTRCIGGSPTVAQSSGDGLLFYNVFSYLYEP
ncbi:MAG: hypothetical protein LBM07_08830 [Culturomica sp.]|nr:hypothetical protein [Culturomica sp.]